MDFLEALKDVFPHKDGGPIVLDEKYSTLEINYEVTSLANVSSIEVRNLISCIPIRETYTLSVIVENNDPVALRNVNNVESFIVELEEEKELLEEGEKIKLIFTLEKATSTGVIHIYCFNAFEKFVGSCDEISFLNVICLDLLSCHKLHFKLLEEVEIFIKTKKIQVSHTDFIPSGEDDVDLKDLREHCHFADINRFPFSPHTFYSVSSSQKLSCSLLEKLDKLSFIFSLAGIFDISAIKEENQFYYKLNGYKTFEGEVSLGELNVGSKDIYLKIYDWIYVGSGSVTDKIGLARNILSIYLKENDLTISDGVYFSIQSGFKTYLQGNLNRYIEIRNKISSELVELTNKANTIIENYLSNYQKSNFSFISFFISVFVLRVLSKGNFKNVFTKDATVISLLLLVLSILYLLFSRWSLNEERKRLIIRYSNLKNRFKDLLIEEDINKILRNDKEFNDELSFLSKRKRAYTFLWVTTVLAFLVAIFSVSSFINWNLIFQKTNEALAWFDLYLFYL